MTTTMTTTNDAFGEWNEDCIIYFFKSCCNNTMFCAIMSMFLFMFSV